MSCKVAVVYHSDGAKTRILAELVAKGAEEVSDDVAIFSVEEVDFAFLDQADAIIFGCPTYMGSASWKMKKFMDQTSDRWSQMAWRNKVGAGFTCSAALSGDKLNVLVQMAIFAFQHGMIWVGLDMPAGIYRSTDDGSKMNRLGSWIGLTAQANVDEGSDISPPESDRETAVYLGKRVAQIAMKMRG